MANALPHAIGAQFADPGRQVISMSGDGGLAMLLGELLTVGCTELPVKIVVFNNSSLGMVKLEMLVDGYPVFETDHGPVDFAAIAARRRASRRRGVEDPADVRRGLDTRLHYPRPLPAGRGHRPQRAVHPAAHHRRARSAGFALAATKTVLDGGVGKMLELARANLRNLPRPHRA